mgnify:CR=1 FL=1
MKRTTLLLLLPFLCSPASAGQWYRGNTHAHTEICGHADSTPDSVAKWYLDHGYNFLILSEHNHFIDPATVNLPEQRRKDFILIPGEEVTGKKHLHSTAMNIDGLVPWDSAHEEKWQIIQDHVDAIRGGSGQPILNHPNYTYAVTTEDILPVKGLHMMELYNGHNDVHNFGDGEHPSTEEMWDTLLSAGMLVYAVASDDMHILKEIAPDKSNPGRGWVVVRSDRLTPESITKAMAHGQFYASSGLFLSKCGVVDGNYVVEVDEESTQAELASSVTVRALFVPEGKDGYSIEFIGQEGKVLARFEGTSASFPIDGSQPYVRVKVTHTRTYPESGHQQFFAWGQPVFSDGRDQ